MPEQSIQRTLAEKIFIGLLCAVALVMPFHKVLPSPLLSLAALVAIFTGGLAAKRERLKNNRRIYLFALLYLIPLAGYLLSDNTHEAATDLQVKLSVLLIPLVLGAYIELKTKEVILILRCFVISCILFAIAAMVKAASDLYATGVNHFYYKDLVSFTFIHPSYIAMFEVFAVVLLLFKLFGQWKQLAFAVRMVHVVVILFLLLFIFLLASKMAILSLFVLLNFTIGLFAAPVYGKLKTFMLLLAINLAGLILIISLPKTRERFIMLFNYRDVGYANSTDSREEIWKSATEICMKHFFTGVGSGDAEQVLVDHYKENGFTKGVEERYNAHNQYLQVWIETGIGGLLLFLFILGWSVRQSLIARNYIWFCFLLLFIINIITESMLKTQSGVVFYAFFNTLLGLHSSRFERALTKS